jgi:hypothetical protein
MVIELIVTINHSPGGIGLGSGNVFLLKVLGSILFGTNFGGLI